MTKETKPTGTQSIERAIDLLKLLATRGTFGWGLTDLSRRSGLDKATVHRILGCLEAQRLVHRDAREHRYFPGPMLTEMGLSVAAHQPLLDEGKALIARLSQRSRGVSFFYLRSGSEFVVAGRVQCTMQRGMLNEIGFRRPLMMSAGGVAMLIAMRAQERDQVVADNLRDMEEMALPRLCRFTNMLERSLRLGYSANIEDVASGINSFAIAVLDAAGDPIGAISVAGDPAQFPEALGEKISQSLIHASSELSTIALKLPIGASHSVPRVDHAASTPTATRDLSMPTQDAPRRPTPEFAGTGPMFDPAASRTVSRSTSTHRG